MTDEFSGVGEFSSPGVPQSTPATSPASAALAGDDENGIDVDAIAGSLTAAPVGEDDVRLISTTWQSVRLEFEISVSGAGPRKEDLELTIGGTEVPIEEVEGPRGEMGIIAEFNPSQLSGIGTRLPVRVEVEDDRGASGSARVGAVQVVSPSASGGRSRTASSSRQASSLATTDENAAFGLSRAQMMVGGAGVGIAGLVLASLL